MPTDPHSAGGANLVECVSIRRRRLAVARTAALAAVVDHWPRVAFQLLTALFLIGFLTAGTVPVQALETIVVPPKKDVLELTMRGTLYEDRGDKLQIETAPGRDGMVARMSIKARTSGTNPNWLVFALTNNTETAMERWLTANRYTFVGSKIVWPDLDARRLEAVTPSIGFIPERIKSDRADVFRLTLEPGQTVTFAVELASDRYPRVFLWKPLAYELKVRERQLFNGALLGLTGLLAVFLTAIFAANHKAIFPTAALVAWSVLAYLLIDFGFFHKLFNLRPEDNAVYRAAAESSVAASLVIFLHTFLRLGYSHGIFRMLMSVWVLAQLALVAIAVVDPRLSATFARLSFLLVGGAGALMIVFLAIRGQDRALSIVPTWLLFLVWIFAAGVTLSGRLAGDIVVASIIGGLVLIVILIGFTVTQFAFRSVEPVYGAAPGDQQIRSLAVDGAGAATFEWNARRDEIKVSPVVEAALGLNEGDLSAKVDDVLTHIHPNDRERFRLVLDAVKERTSRHVKADFRVRHADNSYRWLELEASAMETAEGRSLRCVGLLRDVTDSLQSQERLLNDAVHCPLTRLPNRELFFDRLGYAVRRARQDMSARPTVIYIDIDRFRSVNKEMGLVVGDALLLTVSRRLANQLGDDDTLARMSGDQFAILLVSQADARFIADLAERVRQSIRASIRIRGQDIVLTGSIGIAVYDGQEEPSELVREAEIAMYRAKRSGADRVEIFRPEMRGAVDDRLQIESDLRRALKAGEIKVYYQPIIYLPTEELAGFEALVRWEHPKKGVLPPPSFVPIAEQSDLINELGAYVLTTAAQTAVGWQKDLPRVERPLFVSVNVSSRQLLRKDLVQDVRQILGRGQLPKGTLRLEITESLVMENPEAAVELLRQLGEAGADIALDDFGTGYSSLAYLQRFPFDTIKIDRQFMADDSDDGAGRGPAIVRSVVALAHELGKTVVAEGVEVPDEVSFLRSIGCEYAQGFYYGEAMAEGEVRQLLRLVRRSERNTQTTGLFRLKRTPKAITADNKKQIAASPDVATKTKSSKLIEGTAQRVEQPGAGRDTARPFEPSKPTRPVQPVSQPTHRPEAASDPSPIQRGIIDSLPASFVRPMGRGVPMTAEQLAESGLADATRLAAQSGLSNQSELKDPTARAKSAANAPTRADVTRVAASAGGHAGHAVAAGDLNGGGPRQGQAPAHGQAPAPGPGGSRPTTQPPRQPGVSSGPPGRPQAPPNAAPTTASASTRPESAQAQSRTTASAPPSGPSPSPNVPPSVAPSPPASRPQGGPPPPSAGTQPPSVARPSPAGALGPLPSFEMVDKTGGDGDRDRAPPSASPVPPAQRPAEAPRPGSGEVAHRGTASGAQPGPSGQRPTSPPGPQLSPPPRQYQSPSPSPSPSPPPVASANTQPAAKQPPLPSLSKEPGSAPPAPPPTASSADLGLSRISAGNSGPSAPTSGGHAAKGDGSNGLGPPPPLAAQPDFSKLPPGIARSLAKLAGSTVESAANEPARGRRASGDEDDPEKT